MAQQDHPIFDDIRLGELEAVQQRVLADATVLEERAGDQRGTPLMAAIYRKKPAIALWLLEHWGQHDLEAANDEGWTALHYTSQFGPLEVVQALVAAGANPAALTGRGCTPLIAASFHGHTDIVAFLLQLPAVTASIDHVSPGQYPATALSHASFYGRQPVVQLLLDAGADPTIPAGPDSPLNWALFHNHLAVAALLRCAIDEADRVRVFVACMGVRKGLCKDVYLKVLGCLVHAWAIKQR